MDQTDFEAYLKGKKIDADAFRKARPEQFDSLEKVFDQVHPDSFTAQKLFLINPIRREFRLVEEEAPKEVKPTTKRPVIRPKPKTN